MSLKFPTEVYKNISKLKEYVKTLGIDPVWIKDEDLFLCAFVHKSYASDFKEPYDHNERLEQEIKELKMMLKDRTVHVTHTIRE